LLNANWNWRQTTKGERFVQLSNMINYVDCI
jgi:hypothetical protein